MNLNSVTIFKINLSKAVRNKGSYQWRDPDYMDREKIKLKLNKIASELQKKLLKKCTNQEVKIFVTNTMTVAEPDVSLAIVMEYTLGTLTVEEWQKLGEELQKCLNDHLFEIDKLAKSEATILPATVVQNSQLPNFCSEPVSGAILVSSQPDKIILDTLLDLAQSPNQISCEISDTKSNFPKISKVFSVKKQAEPITKIVYVSYCDYTQNCFGIIFKTDNKRTPELHCDDDSQIKKLRLANQLRCEARVIFATENTQNASGKTINKITHILEVIEVLTDQRYPVQPEFDLREDD